MEFFTVLAWILGVLSTFFLLLRLAVGAWYAFTKSGQLQQTLDKFQGQHRTFPIIVPGIMAIICWAWIFTH